MVLFGIVDDWVYMLYSFPCLSVLFYMCISSSFLSPFSSDLVSPRTLYIIVDYIDRQRTVIPKFD